MSGESRKSQTASETVELESSQASRLVTRGNFRIDGWGRDSESDDDF